MAVTTRRGGRGTARALARACAHRVAQPLLLVHLLALLALVRCRRRIPALAGVTRPDAPLPSPAPRLSVIVPVRNEAAGLRQTVASLLAQDYPDFELVLIDDRSDDGSGALVAELAAARPDRVRALAVTALPAGWLGKNHALWLGARAATGAWLLFADVDVIFDPGCCRRAVAYAAAQRLDHLTLFVDLLTPGYWHRVFIDYYQYAFLALARQPDRAVDPRSRVGLGLGAFNLVARSAYERIGTYAAIALRPDDDLRLGGRVKRAGLRQGVLTGSGLVREQWYPSLGAAIAGIEKNAFASLDYRLAAVVPRIVGLGLLSILPYLLVWPARGRDRGFLAGAIGLHSVGFLVANHRLGRRAAPTAPAIPAGAILLGGALLRSTWRTLRQGGIRWRGTFAPLALLRAQTGWEGLP